MSDLPDSGVSLVAKGAAIFQRTMEAATSAIQKQGEAASKAAAQSAKGNNALGSAIGSLQERYLKLVPGGQASIDMLTQFSASLGISTAATLATVAAVAALAVGLIALGTRGAALTGLADSFDRLTAGVGIASQAMLVDLRKAAAGTVSDFDLIRRANIALAGATGEFGKAFGQNLPKILEIARTQARATSQDVDFLFQSLVTGIKRGSPLLIDNTGLVLKISEANEAYAQSLGKTVEQLTAEEKQIAVLNATLEAGQTAIDTLGTAHETAAEKIARGQAIVTNILDRLGLAVQPGFELILDGVNRILSLIEQLAGAIGVFLSPIVELFGSTFKTIIDIVLSIVEPIVNTILSFVPYIGIAFEAIVNVLRGVQTIVTNIIQGVVNLFKDAAKNFFGLDLENLGPQLFNGAARAFGAFANGIITTANQLIFPAVIGIAQFIADFLIGFSPPKKGPLSKIDEGGANTMTAWLQGMTGISLDPVEKVAAEVSATLGGIGKASLSQVNARLSQLDKALLPFQNRLSIVKSTFDAIAEPAKLALDAIDRQMSSALEALSRGEAGSEETVRRLDAQRAAIEGSLDAQQRLVDGAQVQLALATAQQARERALLNIRKAQLGTQKQVQAVVQKAEKAGAAPKEEKPKTGGAAALTEPTLGGGGITVPTLGADETTLDFLTGGIEAAKAGIQDAFAGEIDTSQLALFQENTGLLQAQIDRFAGVDIGAKLTEKLANVGPAIQTALEEAGTVIGERLTDLGDSITNPEREGSIPYFFQNTLPANIDSATAVISERVSKLFDSIFNPETAGSPAAVVRDLLDSITNPEREGSVPYFFNTTLPDGIETARTFVEDGLRAFFNLFNPNAKDSPAASVKKFVETLFGDSATPGSIANFFASLPDNINAALIGLPAAISTAFGLDNEDSALSQVKNFFATLAGDSSVEGSIASFFVNLPANIVSAIGDLWGALQPLFTPFEDFFTGVGPGSLADIINQGIQWFAALPDAIVNALQSLGRSAYSALVVPVIQAVNGLLSTIEGVIRNLFNSLAHNVNDIQNALGSFAPQFLQGIKEGLAVASATFTIPKLSTEIPAFLAGGATGGIFGEGVMRVGERGQELVASAGRMAVFPNSFTQSIDALTATLNQIIAQPVALPVGGGGVVNDSHDMSVTLNGVRDGNDAVRRFARLRARR